MAAVDIQITVSDTSITNGYNTVVFDLNSSTTGATINLLSTTVTPTPSAISGITSTGAWSAFPATFTDVPVNATDPLTPENQTITYSFNAVAAGFTTSTKDIVVVSSINYFELTNGDPALIGLKARSISTILSAITYGWQQMLYNSNIELIVDYDPLYPDSRAIAMWMQSIQTNNFLLTIEAKAGTSPHIYNNNWGAMWLGGTSNCIFKNIYFEDHNQNASIRIGAAEAYGIIFRGCTFDGKSGTECTNASGIEFTNCTSVNITGNGLSINNSAGVVIDNHKTIYAALQNDEPTPIGNKTVYAFNECEFVSIINTTIDGQYKYGVSFSDCLQVSIKRCQFKNIVNRGIYTKVASNRWAVDELTVDSCYFLNCEGPSIGLETTKTLRVENSTFVSDSHLNAISFIICRLGQGQVFVYNSVFVITAWRDGLDPTSSNTSFIRASMSDTFDKAVDSDFNFNSYYRPDGYGQFKFIKVSGNGVRLDISTFLSVQANLWELQGYQETFDIIPSRTDPVVAGTSFALDNADIGHFSRLTYNNKLRSNVTPDIGCTDNQALDFTDDPANADFIWFNTIDQIVDPTFTFNSPALDRNIVSDLSDNFPQFFDWNIEGQDVTRRIGRAHALTYDESQRGSTYNVKLDVSNTGWDDGNLPSQPEIVEPPIIGGTDGTSGLDLEYYQLVTRSQLSFEYTSSGADATTWNILGYNSDDPVDAAVLLRDYNNVDLVWTYKSNNIFNVSAPLPDAGTATIHFPFEVLNQAYYSTVLGTEIQVATMRIAGLDQTATYRLIMAYSSKTEFGDTSTEYTIGNLTQTLDNSNSGTAEITFNAIQPQSGGFIDILVAPTVTNLLSQGIISGLIIDKVVTLNAPPPVTPPDQPVPQPPTGVLNAGWTQSSNNVKHPYSFGQIVRVGGSIPGTITFTAENTTADSYQWQIYRHDADTIAFDITETAGSTTVTFTEELTYSVKLTVTTAGVSNSILKERCVEARPTAEGAPVLDMTTATNIGRILSDGSKKSGILIDAAAFGTSRVLVLKGSRNSAIVVQGIHGTATAQYYIYNDGLCDLSFQTDLYATWNIDDLDYVVLDGFNTPNIPVDSVRNPYGLGFVTYGSNRGYDIHSNWPSVEYPIKTTPDHFTWSGWSCGGGWGWATDTAKDQGGMQYVAHTSPFESKDLPAEDFTHMYGPHHDHCFFHNCGHEGFYLGDTRGVGSDVTNPRDGGFLNPTWYRNTFYNIYMDCIQLSWCPDGDAEIHDNFFYSIAGQNTILGQGGIQPYGWHSSFVSMNPGFGGRVFNNYANGNYGAYHQSAEPYMPIWLYNNVTLNSKYNWELLSTTGNNAFVFLKHLDKQYLIDVGFPVDMSYYAFQNTNHSYDDVVNRAWWEFSGTTFANKLKLLNNIMISSGDEALATWTDGGSAASNFRVAGNYKSTEIDAANIEFKYPGLVYDVNLEFPGLKDHYYDDTVKAGVENTSPVLTTGVDLSLEDLGLYPNGGGIFKSFQTYRDFLGYQLPVNGNWQSGARTEL